MWRVIRPTLSNVRSIYFSHFLTRRRIFSPGVTSPTTTAISGLDWELILSYGIRLGLRGHFLLGSSPLMTLLCPTHNLWHRGDSRTDNDARCQRDAKAGDGGGGRTWFTRLRNAADMTMWGHVIYEHAQSSVHDVIRFSVSSAICAINRSWWNHWMETMHALLCVIIDRNECFLIICLRVRCFHQRWWRRGWW